MTRTQKREHDRRQAKYNRTIDKRRKNKHTPTSHALNLEEAMRERELIFPGIPDNCPLNLDENPSDNECIHCDLDCPYG